MKKVFVVKRYDRLTRVVCPVVFFSSRDEAQIYCDRWKHVKHFRHWVSTVPLFDSVSQVMSL